MLSIILRTTLLSILFSLLLVSPSFGQTAFPPHLPEIFEIRMDDTASLRQHYGALGFSYGGPLNPPSQVEGDFRCKTFWGDMVGLSPENITALGLFRSPELDWPLLVCKFRFGVPNYLASSLCKDRRAWLFKNSRASALVLCARLNLPRKAIKWIITSMGKRNTVRFTPPMSSSSGIPIWVFSVESRR